jgi:hypothetical protein
MSTTLQAGDEVTFESIQQNGNGRPSVVILSSRATATSAAAAAITSIKRNIAPTEVPRKTNNGSVAYASVSTTSASSVVSKGAGTNSAAVVYASASTTTVATSTIIAASSSPLDNSTITMPCFTMS